MLMMLLQKFLCSLLILIDRLFINPWLFLLLLLLVHQCLSCLVCLCCCHCDIISISFSSFRSRLRIHGFIIIAFLSPLGIEWTFTMSWSQMIGGTYQNTHISNTYK